jgi:hypothetical protein
MKTVMKNITRLVILFRIHKIHQLKSWAHVNTNLDKKVKIVKNTSFRTELMQDICSIQLADLYEMFLKIYNLFFEKWSHKNDSDVDTFIDYFYQQWIAKNFNWFEGAYQGKTSTDNGLESNNKWIKEYTSNSNCCCC